MSALRIFRSAKPTLRMGPIQPMSREDEIFWAQRKRASAEAARRRAARSQSPAAASDAPAPTASRGSPHSSAVEAGAAKGKG